MTCPSRAALTVRTSNRPYCERVFHSARLHPSGTFPCRASFISSRVHRLRGMCASFRTFFLVFRVIDREWEKALSSAGGESGVCARGLLVGLGSTLSLMLP